MQEDLGDRGLRVVLVSQDAPSTAQNVPSFLARYGVTVPWISDGESELMSKYNPSGSLPFSVLLGADGEVIYSHSGYEPGDERILKAQIDKALPPVPEQPATEALTEDSGTLAAAASGPDLAVAAHHAGIAPKSSVRATTQTLGFWRNSRFDPNAIEEVRTLGLVQRIEVAADAGDYSFGVRADGAVVAEGQGMARQNDRDLRLERAHARGRWGPLAAQLGDDHVQFGHGMALSLRQVDPIGVDTTLRGGRVDVVAGPTTTTALVGWTNPQNIDPIDLTLTEDENDRIAGVQTRARLGGGVEVSPYVLAVDAAGAAPDGSDVSWRLGGGALAIERGSIRAVAEAGRWHTKRHDAAPADSVGSVRIVSSCHRSSECSGR